MSRAFSGTAQYLSRSGAPSAYPYTISVWANPTSLPGAGVARTLWSGGNTAAGAKFQTLSLDGDFSGKLAVYSSDDANPFADAHTGNTPTAAAWNHGCLIGTSSTNRVAVLNGDWASRASSTATNTQVGLNTESIGALIYSATADLFIGQLAEQASWNVALTQAEVEALAKGAHPFTIRPANIVSYRPILGNLSPEIDLVGGLGMTVTSATKSTTHPGVWYPANPYFVNEAVAAAGQPTWRRFGQIARMRLHRPGVFIN